MIALFLLSGNMLLCQNNVAVGVTQDLKLALVDDDYGNEPFTLDAILKVEYHAGELDFMTFYGQWERAALAGGTYDRVAFGTGGGFRLGNFIVTPSINFGQIRRFDEWSWSTELQGEITYLVSGNLGLNALYWYTNRTDIGLWRSNFGIGVKYHFRTTDRNTKNRKRLWQDQHAG